MASGLGEDVLIDIFGNVQKMIEDSITDRSGSTAAVYIGLKGALQFLISSRFQETRETSTFAWVGDSSILGIDEVSEQAELLTEPHTLEPRDLLVVLVDLES